MYSKDQLSKMSADELVKVFIRKSSAIRQLDAYGFSRSEIAKMLNIRYQHVRNTLTQELKSSVVTSKIEENDSDDQMNLFSSK